MICIQPTDETIIKQKCKQLLNIFANDYNMKMLVSNNKQYIKNLSIGIDYECNLKNKWKEDYMKRGYKFMSRENIFKNISKILQY
jgi:hypothetical protein